MKTMLFTLQIFLSVLSNIYAQVDTVYVPYLGQIDEKLNFKMNKVNNLFQYNYLISSSIASIQDIHGLNIQYVGDCITERLSPEAWFSIVVDESLYAEGNHYISWGGRTYSIYSLIKPGNSISGFQLITTGLPFIAKYYIQGYMPPISVAEEDEPVIIGSMNIFLNSKKGNTVGPADPPKPFIATVFLDTLISYTEQSLSHEWITDQTTADKYTDYLNQAKNNINQSQVNSAKTILNQLLSDVETDSGNVITSEAYALLRYNTEYLIEQLPHDQPVLSVLLLNSQNQPLTNGTLKYYEGGWKEAVNNGDGTFRVETEQETVKLRMTYAHASQDIADVPVNGGPVTFQTAPVQVELRDSQNQLMDEGTVKYYSGGWRDFGSTTGGIVVKELLPNSYKFRLTYAFASNDITQDVGTDPVVTFQTIPVQVELRDSQNQLIDEGSIKYYSGGWRTFGNTSGGIAEKELLPNSYKFRMTYGYASNDLTQDVGDNETVVFQTVPVKVELRDSQNQLMDEGSVKYYSGGWRTFGNTSGGVVEKELLPNAYKFRMTFAYASNDMTQNVEDNPRVSFQTIQATVELRNSQNQLMDEGTGKYYSGGWRDFGSTTGGITVKELLAQSYKFRINYAYASTDQTQNLSDNETVRFSSIQTIITVKDAQGNLIDGAIVKYYSGGWRNYGTTSGGIVEKELFAKSYKFRATYSGSSRDVIQDVSVNPDVEIVLD